MNFIQRIGGRKNLAYYITVFSVFAKVVLKSLDVETILLAGIVFMASNAVVTASANIGGANGKRRQDQGV